MKNPSPLLAVLFLPLFAACASSQAAAVPSPTVAQERAPGTMVVRRELVAIGPSDLLDPVPVPAVPANEVRRDPNVATLASAGCDNGPGGVRVENGTEFPVSLAIDGVPMVIMGTGEVRRFIAPRSNAYLCLDPSRSHAFAGFAIKRFGDRLYAVPNDFRSEVTMDREAGVTYVVNYERIASGR